MFWETEEPHWINEKGVTYWIDKDTRDYAGKLGLNDVGIFVVETTDGVMTRVITNSAAILYENQSLEAICVRLDIMALDRKLKRDEDL